MLSLSLPSLLSYCSLLPTFPSPLELEFDVVFTDYIGMFGLRDAKLFAPYKVHMYM